MSRWEVLTLPICSSAIIVVPYFKHHYFASPDILSECSGKDIKIYYCYNFSGRNSDVGVVKLEDEGELASASFLVLVQAQEEYCI